MSKRLCISVFLTLALTCAAWAQDGLIGYWQFDEGQGATAADSTDFGNHGTIDGGSWATGFDGSGSALSLSGSGFVDCGNLAGNGPTDALTLAAWINPDSFADWTGIITKGTGGSPYAMQLWGNNALRFGANWGTVTNGQGAGNWNSTATMTAGVWTHVAITYGGGVITFYINGEVTDTVNQDLVFGEVDEALTIGCDFPGGDEYYSGLIDEVQIYDVALTQDEIASAMEGVDKTMAKGPLPANSASDVVRDGIELTWSPGEGAVSHDVYLGTSEEDVENATVDAPLGVLLSAGQDATTYALPRQAFGETQYWRVDEVAADSTRATGKVWSFTVEPYSVQIPGDTIVASASSSTPSGTSDPIKTIDGSGFDPNTNRHSINHADMWFSNSADFSPWLMYEFDDVKQLDTMNLWNCNSAAEGSIGWGIKDVVIEYSIDGVDWTVLEDANHFNQGTGLPTYDQYDVVDFSQATAKLVKITILTNYGGFLPAYAVSEVQFFAIPVAASSPDPADQAVAVVPTETATWRAGREAHTHQVLISQDPDTVSEGLSVTSNTNSIDMTALDLLLGETYYWQVVEVNENEVPSEWPGDVWTFSTTERVMVDDFETYNNFSPDRPFQTWLDGIGYSADEYYPEGYPGNGTGAAVGHDIWSLSSPHYQGNIMEQVLTAEASGQSMPLYYDGNSKTDRVFATAQDWSAAGIETLVMHFNGDRDNAAGTLYVTINNKRVDYPDAAALSTGLWTQWNIDLASLGIALNSVTTMSIGIDSTGSGVVYVDQISLYREAPGAPVSSDPGTANLAALYRFENDYTDSSGHGLDGTPMGAPAFINGLAGNGMAVTLNGADDYVELPIGQLMSTLTDSTFAIWADFSGEGGNWQRLMDFGSGTSQYFLITPSSGGGVLLMEMNGPDAGTSQLAAPMRLPTGWHHVAGVIDSTSMEMTLYLDGTVVAQGPTTSLPADAGVTTQNWLGRSQYPDPYYNGALDEARIYNRVLTEGEIRYLAGDR